MFTHRSFAVKIERDADLSNLAGPEAGEEVYESCVGSNYEYADLRGLSWREVKRVFALESALIERIESAADPEAESELIEAELYDRAGNLFGLDLGTASVVASLSAAGCTPFSSCNGGAFGGNHQEAYPLVAFAVSPAAAQLILAAAEEAGVGLANGPDGSLVAYASNILNFRKFTNRLTRRKRQFQDAAV